MLNEISTPEAANQFTRFVDLATGTVDRRIFADADIYDVELKRIFARAWNFMCHDSQIARPGDFFATFIGEDRVLVTRDEDGLANVLLNTCRHRGNSVCRADEGNASSFTCPYHGWTYDLKGRLVRVPGYEQLYGGRLKLGDWGLARAARVASYKGFVFATLDSEAPPLEEYLGEIGRLAISLIAERGDIAIVDGIQKFRIGCNWKIAVENVFDWYHPQTAHAAARFAGYGRILEASAEQVSGRDHITLLGEYGHAISGPMNASEELATVASSKSLWRRRANVVSALGPMGVRVHGHPNIFPNLWIATAGTQLSLRLPRGPRTTEIWWFTLLDKNLPHEQWEAQRQRAIHTFGPAGILEQDDGENWEQCTRGTLGHISKEQKFHVAMNRRGGRLIIEDGVPPRIEGPVNEHAQLWTYCAWTEWMNAEDWPSLRRSHIRPGDFR